MVRPRRFFSLNYSVLPILIIPVLHTGQVPFVAGLPFFKVTACGSFISRLALHFTQYASMDVYLRINNTIISLLIIQVKCVIIRSYMNFLETYGKMNHKYE